MSTLHNSDLPLTALIMIFRLLKIMSVLSRQFHFFHWFFLLNTLSSEESLFSRLFVLVLSCFVILNTVTASGFNLNDYSEFKIYSQNAFSSSQFLHLPEQNREIKKKLRAYSTTLSLSLFCTQFRREFQQCSSTSIASVCVPRPYITLLWINNFLRIL